MARTLSNYLGRCYPFFLNNYNLTSSYYLYQFFSPKLGEDFMPQLSMTKLIEKTTPKTAFSGQEDDIIRTCCGDENLVTYIDGILRKEDTVIYEPSKTGDFPCIRMNLEDTLIQRNLIVNLRDTLRWKNYRFFPGRSIDVLWTPYEYVVFKLVDDENYIWLEPTGIYKTTDPEMKNPLDVSLDNFDLSSLKWEKSSPSKASDINHKLKSIEWKSFDRRPFVKKH